MQKETRPLSRRQFIQRSAQLAGSTLAISHILGCRGSVKHPPATTPGRIIGANERINVAVIGVRGRGGGA